MSEAFTRESVSSEALALENPCYVVMRSLLLHDHVYSLGEIREALEFGLHLVRLHDCGHVRCIDPFCFGDD